MGANRPGFCGKPGARPQVWRVCQVRGGDCATAESPAEVLHILQVRDSGERGLAEVAGAQRGLVHRSQLRALGITRGSYEHRLQTGALHPVLPSVLSVVYPVLEPLAQETAALLYAGENTVLSHDSAAALWRMARNPSFVALTVVGRHVRTRPGLHVHQVSGLDIRDVRLHQGFPVTSPARTLIDCAVSELPLDRLLNEARALKLVTDHEIHEAMERCPRRTGVRALRALLDAERDSGYTRSEAERLLKRIITEAGIEAPIFNSRVEGIEADAYWPKHRLIVEVDGYQYHGRWASFQSDRARDNHLITTGYTVLRFTWHQLTQRPLPVLAQIVRALTRAECG